ncbi:hypothetical protein [Trichormus variabilis]|uniref:Uncharacterized protein n=1 Tax=Trichormus variabilis SAG 1403-4b TaxID=447716 RepID=A0A3S1C808_ANAVA|nr:hypothetical protein [Trichormus variabilis]MBD2628219.1 hypothetical protein [Trichormus variabilis FACHB-164]RUS96939.1 hypothetical protein DSM107003_23450 [Trichormus variabilis SAG 1403-4b]
MNSSEIANLLRTIADIIESEPKIAKALEKHLANSLNVQSDNNSLDSKCNSSNHTNNLKNGDAVLAQCRQILREQGEEQLKLYLTELGDKVREVLKYGQLDRNRSIRRRKDLNSIIEHIIQQLIAQDKSGKLFAGSISKN